MLNSALHFQEQERRILLDSNILIAIFNGGVPLAAELQEMQHFISAVSVMEVYALAGMSAAEEQRIDEGLRLMNVVELSAPIARRAGILARTRRAPKPDLIIAATALELHMPLLTFDRKDFRRIPDLKLFDL